MIPYLQAREAEDTEFSSSSEEVSGCIARFRRLAANLWHWLNPERPIQIRYAAQASDVSEELDEGFLEAFAKIKQRDASIYDADARLFHESTASSNEGGESASDSGEDAGAAPAGRRENNPKYLRQVLAEQVRFRSRLDCLLVAALLLLLTRACAPV